MSLDISQVKLDNSCNMSDISFDLPESIALLDDELALAYRWDRPSILFAVFETEAARDKAKRLLAHCLQKRKQKLLTLNVNSENFDVALVMANTPRSKETVFSISGLGKGGGKSRLNAFRALNLRREVIVENRLRAVFWLSQTEARQLAKHAPDFWAFRHRMVTLNFE